MASPATETCHFLKLPPEIRNIIYIDYLESYPEVILPDLKSTTVVPRAPLIRVNQQIRVELASLLTFYATHLSVRIEACQMAYLAALVVKLDKRTLETMRYENNQPISTPSKAQLLAVQRYRTLRPRKVATLAASLRQFPALRTLKIDLHMAFDHELIFWTRGISRDSSHRALADLRLDIKATESSKAGSMEQAAKEIDTFRLSGPVRLYSRLAAVLRAHPQVSVAAEDKTEGE